MLNELLRERKKKILESWKTSIFGTYPVDARKFLSGERDRFNNPVGNIINENADKIFDGLLANAPRDVQADCLDKIIRIRSVQDFRPSQAVEFMLLLKPAVRESLDGELGNREIAAELLNFESRIDELVALAFDIYTGCREQIYQIRIEEIRKQSAALFRRSHDIEDRLKKNKDRKKDGL